MTSKDSMFFGATPELFDKAKALRSKLTDEEKKLWNYLKSNPKSGYKFRRQHPVYKYVVDFYCHKARLAIEIDGPDHEEKQKAFLDEERTQELNQLGIKVIRFTNEQVREQIDKVVEEIKHNLEKSEGWGSSL